MSSVSERVVDKFLSLKTSDYAQRVKEKPNEKLVKFAEQFGGSIEVQPLSSDMALVFIDDVVFSVRFEEQYIHYAGTWKCEACMRELQEENAGNFHCSNYDEMIRIVALANKERCQHKVIEVD